MAHNILETVLDLVVILAHKKGCHISPGYEYEHLVLKIAEY